MQTDTRRATSTTAASPRRLWIVDDSPTEAERTRRALANAYAIEVFHDGSAVLEAVAARPPPDVLLLDWVMPGLSGLEICRFLRDAPTSHPKLQILLLTVQRQPSQVAEGLAAGANDYLPKPYAPEELQARVAALIRTVELLERTERAEAAVRGLLDSTPDPLFAFDREGRLTFLSAEAARVLGTAAATCRGRAIRGSSRGWLDGADVVTVGAPRVLPDLTLGAAIYAPVLRRLALADGTRAAVALRDVTAQRQAEGALRARADFEQQLIGIVSHDLKNPLGAISFAAAALARREELDAHTTKSVLRIQTITARTIRLVKDLLDFTETRLGGGIRIAPRLTDLHALTRGVLDEVEATHPGRVVVTQEGDGRGTWDPDRIAQVVQNLVQNAIQYSPEDSSVQVVTRAEAGGVSLAVSNGGAPIPEEKLSRICEPFERAAAEVDKAGRSVGLGLYIVKHIVEAHGGTLVVRSTPEEGTLFTVQLPRNAP